MQYGSEKHDVEVRARLPRSLADRLGRFADRARRDRSNAVCILIDYALDQLKDVPPAEIGMRDGESPIPAT